MTIPLKKVSIDAKVTKFALHLIKWTLTIAAVFYITVTINNISQNEVYTWKQSIDNTTQSIALLFLAILLMPANWGLEVLKWKILSKKVEHISWNRIIRGILQGITSSLRAPERVSEFVGRVTTLSPHNRLKGVLLNSAGSVSQLVVTLVTGLSSIIILVFNLTLFPTSQALPKMEPLWLIVTALSISIIFAITIFTLVVLWVAHKPQSQIATKLFDSIRVLSYLSLIDLAFILLLSIIRYFVIVLQFYILLLAFGMEIPLFMGMALIATIYLVLAIIPLSAIWDLGIRGSAAIYIFKTFSQNSSFSYTEISVLTATFVLWIINLGIPALMGAISKIQVLPFRQQNA